MDLLGGLYFAWAPPNIFINFRLRILSSAVPSSSAMSLFDYFDSAAASPSPTAFHMMAIPQAANTANAFAGDERCAVCGDGAHGVHFGVQVCRACAAFFRRSTIARRVYRCRYDGNCAIDQPEVRCACRACRFAKCLALGMDPAAVQRNRDQIGPRRHKATAANPGRRTDGGEIWRHNSSSPPQQNFMPISSSNFLLPPLFTADTAGVQLHGVAKWEHFEEEGIADVSTTSTTTREVHVEDGKLYALLGKVPRPSVTPAADQLFLLRRALPSAFSAPPPTQQRQPPQQQQPQTTHTGGGGDSGNASASSSVFASPQQHSPTIGVGGGPSCSSAAITHQQPSPAAAAAPFILDNGIPLISEMLRGYRRFKTLRLSAHYLTGNLSQNQLQQTLLGDCEEKDLVLANYADNVNILRTDLSLLSEMVEQSFPPLQGAFSMDSKWALLRNFLCPFFIAERSHLTAQRFPPNDTRLVASPYHYFDLARLDHFFAVEQCKTRPEDIARVFEPTFRKIFFLFSDFHTLRLIDEEFVGLMGLLFWNDQVDGINGEERSLALNTRERLFAELYTVSCRRQAEEVAATTTADWGKNSAQRGGTSGGERFCTILNKLHFCQKLSLEIASNFSLVNVSRTFEVDPFLHQFNPQTF
uniref:Nuclear receptor n=1 Tax=Globodera rostochiensis TaxID=31243 RepID=A0A914I6W0_GLORO